MRLTLEYKLKFPSDPISAISERSSLHFLSYTKSHTFQWLTVSKLYILSNNADLLPLQATQETEADSAVEVEEIEAEEVVEEVF